MSEFDFIERIREKVRISNKNVILGIGDDCAIINGDRELLVTVDASVENVHFKTDWDSGWMFGRKLVRINISDIYSKGGNPLYALLSIGVDYKKKRPFVERYIDGVIYELEKYNIQLVGGNVSSAKNDMFFDLVLMGEVAKKRLKRRDGAKRGDIIAVSGLLGDASCGLDILLNNQSAKSEYKRLVDAFMLPDIRYFGNKKLWDYVTSSIDISDGLIGDLKHILDESRCCGAVIEKERIPVSKELTKYCKKYQLDIYKYVLGGGEDYKILVTLRDDTPYEVLEKSGFSVIGLIDGKKGIRISGIKKRYESFRHF